MRAPFWVGLLLCSACGGSEEPTARVELLSEPIAWDVLEAGHVAWTRYDRIVVLDASRRRATQLTIGPDAPYGFVLGGPALSPDGQMLAFVASFGGGKNRPYIVPIAGGRVQELAEPDGATKGIAWSSDGSSVFASVVGPDFDGPLMEFPRDGSGPHQAVDELVDGSVAVSPNGSEFAMTLGLHLEHPPGIYLMSAGGSEPTPLVLEDSVAHLYGPAWSPDGERIAFVRRNGPNESVSGPHLFEIMTIARDGTDLVTELSYPFEDYPCDALVSFSPAGDKLAFSRCAVDADGGVHIDVLDLATGETTPLTQGDVFETNPSWAL